MPPSSGSAIRTEAPSSPLPTGWRGSPFDTVFVSKGEISHLSARHFSFWSGWGSGGLGPTPGSTTGNHNAEYCAPLARGRPGAPGVIYTRCVTRFTSCVSKGQGHTRCPLEFPKSSRSGALEWSAIKAVMQPGPGRALGRVHGLLCP